MYVNPKLFEINKTKRYAIHQGGQGSGKTWCNLYYLLIYCFNHPGTIATVVSESLPHLKLGCIRILKEIINTEGWTFITENKSDHTFYFPNKSLIEFIPGDNAGKMRGPRRHLLFINECNNVHYEVFNQLDARTHIRTILDFNPLRRFWVHDILIPRLEEKDYNFLISTYRDNPLLPQAEIDNILSHKGNPNYMRIFADGEIGNAEGLVFTNWSIFSGDMPGTLRGYGIDFGFVNSKTAIVQVNECNGEIFVKELLYKTGLHNEEIINFVKTTTMDLHAQAIADSAEPKTIDYLFRAGWTGLKPAVKGTDSVINGINLLLGVKINIHKESFNLLKEFREYMWDEDKNGKPLNVPIKDNDHAIDALRYLYSYPKKRTKLLSA